MKRGARRAVKLEKLLRQNSNSGAREVLASQRALTGFFLSGLLLSFVGAILPAWGYHLRPHYVTLGNYFLAIVAGVLAGVRCGGPILGKRGTGAALILAAGAAFASLLLLSLSAPPADEMWRLPGLLGIGFAAGLLNRAVFQAISPAYRTDPAGTVNLGGIFFGLGSFLSPILVAGTFRLYSVAAILFVIALVPAGFAVYYSRLKFPARQAVDPDRTIRDTLKEFTMPRAVLLSAVLFFHFGNEWAIAGWLPLFLILRLGLDPVTALVLLSAYWLALMLGRVAVQPVLSRVSHAKLLLSCIVASLFGCLILGFTNNLFGATLGTLLVGLGFAPIYPLVVEAIGERFPHYHPGFFNGIFSIALTGGMLAPATLGYFAEFVGLRAVTLLPVFGSVIVLLLVLVIWLEAWFARWTSTASSKNAASR